MRMRAVPVTVCSIPNLTPLTALLPPFDSLSPPFHPFDLMLAPFDPSFDLPSGRNVIHWA